MPLTRDDFLCNLAAYLGTERLGRLAGRLLTLAERDPELPTLLHDT